MNEMNEITPAAIDPAARRQTRLVIVRANAPLFYSVVLASFLETDAATGAQPLMRRLAVNGDDAEWLGGQWLPAKESRSNALRLYAKQCWPEFDWPAAYDDYRARLAEAADPARCRLTPAREALAHCVNAAQAGLYYRALGRWSDDHHLRALARAVAQQEATAFERFRCIYEQSARRNGAGIFETWRVTRGAVRYARDTRVRLAFEALNAHVSFNAPFPILEYPEFLRRMRSVIGRCASPAWSERMLFKAWWSVPKCAVAETRPSVARWFTPVLSQAA